MKLTTGLLLAALLVAAAARAQNTASTAAIEKQLISNEHALNEAFAKHNLKALQALIDPTALNVDASGATTLAEMEKWLDSVSMPTWSIEHPRVYWPSPDSAIVMYRFVGEGTIGGQKIPSPTWASTLYIREKSGKWLAKFHQETVAAAPSPAAKR